MTGRERSWGGEELSEGGLSCLVATWSLVSLLELTKCVCVGMCVLGGRGTGVLGRADYGVAPHLLKSNIRLVRGVRPREALICVEAGAYSPTHGVLYHQGCSTPLPGNSHHLNPPKS